MYVFTSFMLAAIIILNVIFQQNHVDQVSLTMQSNTFFFINQVKIDQRQVYFVKNKCFENILIYIVVII